MKVRDFMKRYNRLGNECSLCVETSTGAKMVLIEKLENGNRINVTDNDHPIMNYLINEIEAKMGVIILHLKKKRMK